jgi:hypothetical protein
LIGGAVIQSTAVLIDEGDHVSGVFTNELEELIALRQLPANAVKLQMLVNSVEIEE